MARPASTHWTMSQSGIGSTTGPISGGCVDMPDRSISCDGRGLGSMGSAVTIWL